MTARPLPRVSVIVPTYQRAGLVVAAVRSALDQGVDDIEVIVVDDGSTDDTAEKIAAIGDDRIRYLARRVTGGPAAARNDGLEAAFGEVIAFLDSDDEWLPGKLQLQLACFDRFPQVGMICTELEAVDPSGAVVIGGLQGIYANWHGKEPAALLSSSIALSELTDQSTGRFWWGDLLAPMLRGNLVHTSTVAIRRSRIDKAGPFDTSLTESGEDFDFHLRTCAGGPVGYVDIPTIRYRFGASDQLTAPAYFVALSRNYLRTLEKAEKAFDGDPRLQPGEIRAAVVDARAWYGEELLAAGNRAQARRHLAAGLRRPTLRRGVLFADALLPGAVSRRLRGWYRSLRTWSRSRAGR